MGRTPAPLPSSFEREPSSPFVGRAAELARLQDAYREALAGRLQLVFIAGEPGIGKTRLVRELCVAAHADGAEIMLGRCYEESVVPFQPFVQAMRRTIAATSDEVLAQLASTCRLVELVSMLPEIAQRLPELRATDHGDREGRFRLFETIATLLAEVAARSGAVLVLDDLQWADAPTLALLRHVLRTVETASLLVLATYHTSEVGHTDPLSGLLAELRSEDDAHTRSNRPAWRAQRARNRAADERLGGPAGPARARTRVLP
jgi:predicted ATPase